ncbi:MAG: NUDIX domain-containing protein, partial [Parabacteroides sp.]
LFAELAAGQLNLSHPGLHNQAMMELGAIQCVPQHPDCSVCPWGDFCLAYAQGHVADYPVKQGRTKVRDRYFHYFYIIYKGHTWIHRRAGKDIWEGLYELPLIETEQPADFVAVQQTEAFHTLFEGCGPLSVTVDLADVRHVLSHQVLHATFYRVEVASLGKGLSAYQQVACETLEKYAVPRLIHIYWEKLSGNLSV